MDNSRVLKSLLIQTGTVFSDGRKPLLNDVGKDASEVVLTAFKLDDIVNELNTTLRSRIDVNACHDPEDKMHELCQSLGQIESTDDSERLKHFHACRGCNPEQLHRIYEKVMDHLARLINLCDYWTFEQWCDMILLHALTIFLGIYAWHELHSEDAGFSQKDLINCADQILEIADALDLAKTESRAKIFLPHTTASGEIESELQTHVADFMRETEIEKETSSQLHARMLGLRLSKLYPWFKWAVVIAEDSEQYHNVVTHCVHFPDDLFFQRSTDSKLLPSTEVVSNGMRFGVLFLKQRSAMGEPERIVTVFWIREEEMTFLDNELYSAFRNVAIPELSVGLNFIQDANHLEPACMKDLLSHGLQPIVCLAAFPQRSNGQFGLYLQQNQSTGTLTWPTHVENASGHLILWLVSVNSYPDDVDSLQSMSTRGSMIFEESRRSTPRNSQTFVRRSLSLACDCGNAIPKFGSERLLLHGDLTSSATEIIAQEPTPLSSGLILLENSRALKSETQSAETVDGVPAVHESKVRSVGAMDGESAIRSLETSKKVFFAVDDTNVPPRVTPSVRPQEHLHRASEAGGGQRRYVVEYQYTTEDTVAVSSPVASRKSILRIPPPRDENHLVFQSSVNNQSVPNFVKISPLESDLHLLPAFRMDTEKQSSIFTTPKSWPTKKKSVSSSDRHNLHQSVSLSSQDADAILQAALRAKEKGNQLFVKGDPNGATEQYEKVQQLLKSSAVSSINARTQRQQLWVASCVNLAAVHLKMENLSAAKKFADAALAVDPANATALFKRGAACLGLGDYCEAEQDFLRLSVLSPNTKDVALLMGYAQKGRRLQLAKELPNNVP